MCSHIPQFGYGRSHSNPSFNLSVCLSLIYACIAWSDRMDVDHLKTCMNIAMPLERLAFGY
jgi:hypothetical protein